MSNVRVVLGAVAEKPLRASAAESYLNGKQLNDAVFTQAATKASAGATPLTKAPGTNSGSS